MATITDTSNPVNLAPRTAADYLELASSDKHQAGILHDVALWKSLAARDLKYPERFFERHLGTMTPAQAYQYLSRCQHLDNPDGTIFPQRCGKPIYPGTSFCREHCINHSLVFCRCCQINFTNLENHQIMFTIGAFCRECHDNKAWENGCKRIFNPGTLDIPCGAPRASGSDYCEICRKY
jgi:hypothetical protein